MLLMSVRPCGQNDMMMMMITMMLLLFHQPEEEEGRNGFSATSRHTRKSNSFDIGTVCLTLCMLQHTCCLTHDMHSMHAVQLYIHVCLSAQLAVFVHNLQQWCNASICYQKKAACSLLFDVLPSRQSLLAVCCITALSCNPLPSPPLQFPHPTFVSVSCHFPSGMERDSPYDLERSSDRRLPVKKPRFPQYRNRSLDCPAGTRCMYLFHLLLVCVV